MATVNAQLRTDKVNKQGEHPVRVVYKNGREFRISTGYTVHPDNWNPTPKSNNWVSDSHPGGNEEMNQYIYNMITEVTQLMNYFKLQNKRYPSHEEMRELYEQKNSPEVSVSESFFIMFDNWVTYQSTKRGYKNVSYGTVKNYKKTRNKLTEFQTFTGTKVSFELVKDRPAAMEFYNAFINYLTKEHDSGINTIGSHIKVLKTFFKDCIIKGVKIPAEALAVLIVGEEENWFTFVEMEELVLLLSLDFTNAPLWDKSRDAFCLQCCIGCRYGDLGRLINENIVKEAGQYFFKIKSRKSSKLQKIPLSEMVYPILEKYKGINPKDWILPDQLCNRYIKKVCEQAGMTETIQVTRGRGDMMKDLIFKKFELITTHSARRSFINLMRSLGERDEVICEMTGQSLRTIQRYKHGSTADITNAMGKFDTAAKQVKINPLQRIHSLQSHL